METTQLEKTKEQYNREWRAMNPNYSKNYMKKWRAEGRDYYSKQKHKEYRKAWGKTDKGRQCQLISSKKSWYKAKQKLDEINDLIGFPEYIRWRYIIGTERRYAVSDTGQVFDIKFSTLVLPFDNHKCIWVSLKIGDKYERFKLYQLVGKAFLNRSKKKGWVEHINNDYTNNTITNLYWVNPLEKLLKSQLYADLKSVNFNSWIYFRKFGKNI